MALPRIDVRCKLDPEWHEVLTRVAARDSVELSEYVEKVVLKALKKLLHEHHLNKQHFDDLAPAGQIKSSQAKGH